MFQTGAILVTLFNVTLWVLLRRQLKLAFPKRGNLLSLVAAAVMFALLHPVLFMAAGSWSGMRAARDAVPEWFQLVCIAAQFAAFFQGVLLLPVAGFKLYTRFHAKPKSEVDTGRRAMMARAALVIPAAALVMGAGTVASSRVTPVITRLRLKVPREMTALHGVTIAQVSDVHIGSYMNAERLDEISGVMNATGADFHVITGDLIDNHVNQLELADRFLRSLKPGRESFQCMGNHEYIAARSADNDTIIKGLNEAGAPMLIDEARKISIGGQHFWMAGIDYPRDGRRNVTKRETFRESLDATVAQMADDGAPRIVLSHHPRAFFDAREMPVDLMLSGHTHGGQIKLGRIGDAALTPILPIDYYHNGHYQHDGRQLYVNAGTGGWLPARINCPPEVTLIEFVSA